MSNIVLDTNILIDNPQILSDLINEGYQVHIPYIVLQELDNLKRNEAIGYFVRKAIREISLMKDKLVFDTKPLYYNNNELSNDEKILNYAKENNAIVYTNDIHMSILADSLNIKYKLIETSVFEKHFEPYIYITVEEIADLGFTFQDKYKKDKLEYLIEKYQIEDNSQKFLLIEDKDKMSYYVYAFNPLKDIVERIDNKSEYREIKTTEFKIKALDIYQIIAIYALKEAPNVLITGKWGSGKNILSVSYSIAEKPNSKIFITRPNIGINSKFDIGYLPGDKHDKLIEWNAGFLSALYFIYGNTKGQKERDISYDFVKEVLFPQKFEILPLNMIQGLSLLEGDIMIVDEIQLISVDYMSMLLSRFSKGSRLIMLGDYKQAYNVVHNKESGLLSLIQNLPHKELCQVKLKNTHRSGLTELADKIKNRLDI